MSTSKMHDGEADIDEALIRRLLGKQFPEWANLDLTLMQPEGTDNAMYRLGRDKLVRLPRLETSATTMGKESVWLPKLAPHLPLSIPEILGIGAPGEGYPYPWLVCKWLEGENPTEPEMLDPAQAAEDLGHFVKTLQGVEKKGAPECNRGKPLSLRDNATRKAIPKLADFYDPQVLTQLWEEALEAPLWSGEPVWIHGDLHAGNVLTKDGRVKAVIDFGASGIGDPAADLMVAWTLLTPETREIFRAIVQPDEDTWSRGRGWALTMGIVAQPYYRDTNPLFARLAKNILDAVVEACE